jgi:hypothetical protein
LLLPVVLSVSSPDQSQNGLSIILAESKLVRSARTFQRDTLLALARHLTDASIAAKLASLAHEAAGYPETFQNDNIAIFEEHIIEARHREFFVDDEQVRTLSGETIRAAADLITIKDKESADAKSKEAADLYIRVGNRIGELVRKH